MFREVVVAHLNFECNFVRTTSKEKMGGEYRVCEIEVVLECL